MDSKTERIISLQKKMIDALRIVIAAAGALHYAAYENLKPISNELKEIDYRQQTPSILDFKKDIEKIISLGEGLNQKLKIRFVSDSSQENFENISFGIFQCISMLAVKPEYEIYQEAIRLSGTETNYASLPNQVEFLQSVVKKARKSNHDAINMVLERMQVLESLNIQPIVIEEKGNVKVLDIAPEREEIEQYH